MPSFMIIQTHKSRTPCPIRKLTSAQFCGNATYNTEGFLGGAFSSYAGDSWLDASSSNYVITDTMISSVIGGVSAELGGGKFVNGARSAAFVNLYNRSFRPNSFRNSFRNNTRKLGKSRQQQQREILLL
jgi:hypothetical protein